MRVLHLPTAVGGNPPGLSRELRALGIDSEVWTLSQNYLEYPVDRVIAGERDGRVVRLLKMLGAGRYVFGRWDVVHFNYGSTLFSTWYSDTGRRGAGRVFELALNAAAVVAQRIEVGILRLRRIPIFVHYQGDDARQGDYSLEHFPISIATQVDATYYTPRTDAFKRRQIAYLARRSAGMFAVNPDLMNVLPESAVFTPYGHVAVGEWTPSFPALDDRPLVFAHAPSNRRVKGTDLILEALQQLASEGYRFEIDLIEGVDNATALERYRAADVVIDQLYAGWYGGVALEAMAMGKPVVVYLRDSDFRFLPPAMEAELPFFRATPSTIVDDLRAVLDLPRADLIARARASRAYAERWHDPAAISAGIADAYRRALSARPRRPRV